MLLIHSETFLPLAFAAAVTRLSVSGFMRTGTICALACALGNLGRPTFLAFG